MYVSVIVSRDPHYVLMLACSWLDMDSGDSTKLSRNDKRRLAYASMNAGRKDDLLAKMRNYRSHRSEPVCSPSATSGCSTTANTGESLLKGRASYITI